MKPKTITLASCLLLSAPMAFSQNWIQTEQVQSQQAFTPNRGNRGNVAQRNVQRRNVQRNNVNRFNESNEANNEVNDNVFPNGNLSNPVNGFDNVLINTPAPATNVNFSNVSLDNVGVSINTTPVTFNVTNGIQVQAIQTTNFNAPDIYVPQVQRQNRRVQARVQRVEPKVQVKQMAQINKLDVQVQGVDMQAGPAQIAMPATNISPFEIDMNIEVPKVRIKLPSISLPENKKIASKKSKHFKAPRKKNTGYRQYAKSSRKVNKNHTRRTAKVRSNRNCFVFSS